MRDVRPGTEDRENEEQDLCRQPHFLPPIPHPSPLGSIPPELC
jgi:hypothetical protein